MTYGADNYHPERPFPALYIGTKTGSIGHSFPLNWLYKEGFPPRCSQIDNQLQHSQSHSILLQSAQFDYLCVALLPIYHVILSPATHKPHTSHNFRFQAKRPKIPRNCSQLNRLRARFLKSDFYTNFAYKKREKYTFLYLPPLPSFY